MRLRKSQSYCLCRYELSSKNDQEAYEMGVSKAFKPIMENTLKYLNVGSKKMKQNLHNIQKYQM